MGVAAIGCAFLVEAVLPGWQVPRFSKVKGPLFASEIEQATGRGARH